MNFLGTQPPSNTAQGPLQPTGRCPGALFREASAPCLTAWPAALLTPTRVWGPLPPPTQPLSCPHVQSSERQRRYLSLPWGPLFQAGRVRPCLLSRQHPLRKKAHVFRTRSKHRIQCDGWVQGQQRKLTLCPHQPLGFHPPKLGPPLFLTLSYPDPPPKGRSALVPHPLSGPCFLPHLL